MRVGMLSRLKMVVVILGMQGPGLELTLPDLTPTQVRYLMAIQELTATSGTCTTMREICRFLEVAYNSVMGALERLERKGYIVREKRKNRTIRLAKPLVWRELEEKPLWASTN